MLKTTFILILGLLVFQKVSAKNDTLKYYIKNSGQVVANKASADYTLFIMPRNIPDEKGLFPVIAFYRNGKRKVIAASHTQSLNLVLEGAYTSYFPNGNRKSVMNYVDGNPLGDATEYYPNGKIYAVRSYKKHNTVLLIECRDSTGKVLAQNGNGEWLKFDENFKAILEEGPVSNGHENGRWDRIIAGKKYSMVYTKGTITTDVDYNQTGKVFKTTDVQPAYNGGQAAFNAFLKHTIIPPTVIIDNNIIEKVLVTFIVEKDGTLTDLRVTKTSFSGLLDAEALRVMSLSPPWIPGTVQGRPERTRYTVTIDFK